MDLLLCHNKVVLQPGLMVHCYMLHQILRIEGLKFNASLGHQVRPPPKKTKTKARVTAQHEKVLGSSHL